jgi:ELWxxDGT repeat protein
MSCGLFFRSLGSSGHELWKSDGTAAGTVLVKDLNPGSGVSDLVYLTAVGSTLFFSGYEPATGGELWKSDGTAAGTVLVKDIIPGTDSSGPGNLKAVGSTLFFQAYEPTTGYELWKSDGTAAGTVLVKDIIPGSGYGYLQNLTAVGSTLFFVAYEPATGYELWKSDGTAAGTVLMKDINPGAGSSSPQILTAMGSTLFFVAYEPGTGHELWKSDGTAAGTVLLKDINPGTEPSYPGYLTALGTTLFFSAYEPTTGNELWKSDGTAAGTVLASDIFPGDGSSYPNNLFALGQKLFFSATDQLTGLELWYAYDAPPQITSVTGPTGPLALGNSATLSVAYVAGGDPAAVTVTFLWDDGTQTVVSPSSPGAASATRVYTAAGVYGVTVRVADEAGNTAEARFEYVVVYDPAAGFVTGGGWILSPPGAYTADPSLTGKANFGFVSQYKKGATVPTGETEFEFSTAKFHFHSKSYQWLVISGPLAQYKGTGYLEDGPTCGFLLTANDGQVAGGGGIDKFRIKIWDLTSGVILYDNRLGASDDINSADPQALGGGSITIKKAK